MRTAPSSPLFSECVAAAAFIWLVNTHFYTLPSSFPSSLYFLHKCLVSPAMSGPVGYSREIQAMGSLSRLTVSSHWDEAAAAESSM